jgi:hypothetical protein
MYTIKGTSAHDSENRLNDKQYFLRTRTVWSLIKVALQAKWNVWNWHVVVRPMYRIHGKFYQNLSTRNVRSARQNSCASLIVPLGLAPLLADTRSYWTKLIASLWFFFLRSESYENHSLSVCEIWFSHGVDSDKLIFWNGTPCYLVGLRKFLRNLLPSIVR